MQSCGWITACMFAAIPRQDEQASEKEALCYCVHTADVLPDMQPVLKPCYFVDAVITVLTLQQDAYPVWTWDCWALNIIPSSGAHYVLSELCWTLGARVTLSSGMDASRMGKTAVQCSTIRAHVLVHRKFDQRLVYVHLVFITTVQREALHGQREALHVLLCTYIYKGQRICIDGNERMRYAVHTYT